MRYLTTTAPYVGVDLHARTLFVCVLDSAGVIKLSRNMPAKPDPPPSLRGRAVRVRIRVGCSRRVCLASDTAA